MTFRTKGFAVAVIVLAFAGRPAGGQAAPEAEAAREDPFAEAAGLRPLRLQPLPPGTREIRVWIGGGLGWPQELFRLVERRARQSGEYIRYWSLDNLDPVGADGVAADSETFAALMRYHERGRCEPIRRARSAEACRALFQKEPDWKAVWRAVDSLGVWTLPDESTLPEVVGPHGERIVTVDGWGITAELRDARTYRVWTYGNPDTKPWPEAARANAFAAALRRVSTLVRLSSAEHVYVGRVDVRADTLEFTPCANDTPWLLLVNDARLVRTRGSSAPPTPSRHAVLRGTLAPEWVVRDWWHVPLRFQRALQADSVLALSPWDDRGCVSSGARTR